MTLDALLQPISDAAPCGTDLSFSAEFDELQELRRADDPTLPQGEFVTDLKTADWQAAADLCEHVLATRTKDLRVSGWLAEAWSHLHGFAGLADGLSLVDAICGRFWTEAHPTIDDGDMDMRIGALSWLLSRTEDLSGRVALLKSGNRGLGRIEVEAARARPGRAAVDGGTLAPDDGTLTADHLTKVQRETPSAELVDNHAQARRALQALNALQATLDGRLGIDAPGFASARNALEAAVHAARRLARESGAEDVDSSRDDPPTGIDLRDALAAPMSTRSPSAGGAGPLQTRPQAIQQLRNVAEFFRRTEPHSPVAYLADKAAKWGEMPLHEWLQAVLKDGAALTQLDDVLGIKRAGTDAAG